MDNKDKVLPIEKFEDLTDEECVKQILAGDKQKYRIIISRYEKKLVRYVTYLCYDSTLAEDVVQETFIKVYSNLNSFKSELKFSSWIYRIAHNEAMNAVKKFRFIPYDYDLVSLLIPSSSNVAEDYEKEEIVKNVNLYLQRIPLKYRQVLSLYYLEDKSYGEISDILRLPIGTVGTLLNRAKKKFKDLVKEEIEK